jgi:hypothetical protein
MNCGGGVLAAQAWGYVRPAHCEPVLAHLDRIVATLYELTHWAKGRPASGPSARRRADVALHYDRELDLLAIRKEQTAARGDDSL